ncbi:MAG TPA: FliH/SctL family protein [Deltaproteobacteria bacterium]|mgnify:CR=1 FL=1|nr:FliH/SctL family protein [Deltaproteobacteria bacterium]
MSSSKIIRDDCETSGVTPYRICEMEGRRTLMDAKAQAEAILSQARMEKEAIEMEAYRKGLEQGQAQGQMMALKRIEPLMETLNRVVEELRDMRQAIIEKHKDQIVEILLIMAQRIVHRAISLDSEIVLDTVRQACAHIAETDEIRIRLNPSDFEYIKDIERILSSHFTPKTTPVFVEDPGVDRGGVIIETVFGEIDANIRTQLEHMREVLLEQ